MRYVMKNTAGIAVLALASIIDSQPIDYTVTCGEKSQLDFLQCNSIAQTLVPDITCCRYYNMCGDLTRCSEEMCCQLQLGETTDQSTTSQNTDSSTIVTDNSLTIVTATISATTAATEDNNTNASTIVEDASNTTATSTFAESNDITATTAEVITNTATELETNTPDDELELVDNTITCAVMAFEEELTCAAGSGVAADIACCRWHNACDGLLKCLDELCCVEGIAPSPSPSPVQIATGEFLTTCGAYDGIVCDEGNDLLSDVECCEFDNSCTDNVLKCRSGLCCADTVAGLIPVVESTISTTQISTTSSSAASVASSTQAATTNGLSEDEDEDTPDGSGTDVDRPNVPATAQDACSCEGGVIDGLCYDDLSTAIETADDEDVVYIGGSKSVANPIRFSSSVTIQGVACSGTFPTLTATFDSTDGAILEATNSDTQKVELIDLRMTGSPGMRSAGFHTLGAEGTAGSQRVELSLSNVHMYDMTSERPGVGVFVGNSAGLVVDGDCTFTGLLMSTSDTDRYAGGAAVAVIYLDSLYTISISGTFEDNKAYYPEASLHSGGGAVYLDFMAGDVTFERGVEFRSNEANQGGAIHVQEIVGEMIVDGLYLSNQANDDGFGARGGALRVQKLSRGSRVYVVGTFTDNEAEGRGGVVATNVHLPTSELVFDGDFRRNTASTAGGVWSYWSSVDMDGTVVFEGNSEFSGNRAIRDEDTSIYDMAGEDGNEATLSEEDWEGDTVQIN
ncbi:hypothetical protein SARC_09208 [Sphaeroforma arctica JP610]|uniref:Uncharacterized protein n=1 Tax=Sphaeroforma arctica JP610 TaxID=667725 RepID=A0A0L0FPB4_9EUKA|nr:hypothetical protein SARC_09208 [Sphaeroforma arctica JP610]KNC78356.1 hypothetical protein SARC_09208 [Sphaeroforma arctica JP610]|eukprot:XP_014152258.1 hypothetical protein SARC_09208 [Sphaeroforma arctica JP610]